MLKLEIVTPERRVLDAEVDMVAVPTLSGQVGILPGHAPLVSSLKPGVLAYARKGVTEKLAVSGGFVEVNNNKVSVLADQAERADEISLEAAKAEREAAEKALAASSNAPVEENAALWEQLYAADARIALAQGK
jgi:F-type H+-transporting ATPase subunit epsilon